LVLEAVAHPDVVAVQEGAERFDLVVRQVDGDKGPPGSGRALAANSQYGDAQGNMATIRLGSCDVVSSLSLGSGMRSANARIKADR
jgi:hypothetical protein